MDERRRPTESSTCSTVPRRPVRRMDRLAAAVPTAVDLKSVPTNRHEESHEACPPLEAATAGEKAEEIAASFHIHGISVRLRSGSRRLPQVDRPETQNSCLACRW